MKGESSEKLELKPEEKELAEFSVRERTDELAEGGGTG